MKIAAVMLLLHLLFGGRRRERAAVAIPPLRSSSASTPPLPAGRLPGVPPELQAPVSLRLPAGALATTAATPARERAALDAPLPSTRGPAPSSRGTRLSVQQPELPSTPLAEGMTVNQRARARQLGRAAAAAVRGEGPARRAGVQPQPLAPVAAFQAWVGLPADGKWGRETRRYAAAFTGETVPAEVW